MPTTASASPSPPEAFGPLVSDVLRLLRTDFLRRTREQSLTPQLHRLLLIAHRHPGCLQVQLAEKLDITPVTVGRMLDRLEKQGLLRREQHSTDRRATRIHLEPGALPIVKRLTASLRETGERALAGLDAAQREALLASLRRVQENLAQAPERIGTERGTGTHGR